jgi:uncharacterized SAM-binding protein YcdF (DUF218 family)
MLRSCLEALVIPPLALFALAGLGALIHRWRPRLGRALIGAAVVLLWALAMPLVSAGLARSLQSEPSLDLEHLPIGPGGPGAIVVLGADARVAAPEYGGASVAALTLERLRYAARLSRASGLPILTCGGPPRRNERSVAELMAETLERDFGSAARWTETRSANTRENLAFAAELLAPEEIESIFLVTHAWHMPRAAAAARAAGLTPIPAPTAFVSWPPAKPSVLLPSAHALRESSWALHEWIGRAWYALGG